MMINELLARIEKLETDQAFQEASIETLNQMVIQLQAESFKLKEQLRVMAEKYNGMQAPLMASQSEETPPPHY